MNIFRRFNQKGWSFEFGYDDAYQFESLLTGELKYKENICNLSEKNFSSYINHKNIKEDFRELHKKTVLLVNGEIRNSEKFIQWAYKIKNYSYIYIYTDKLSYEKLEKDQRYTLENISSDICFSEEDSCYQENMTRLNFQNGMRQWLKFRQSINKWEKEWTNKKVKTILRLRSDIAFLNPYLLEHYIKYGFSGLVNKDTMIARSDLLFAFALDNHKILKGFYDSIFSFYLKEDWIRYPYIPLNPDLIIRSRGSIRIEWNNFPKKYIGINPSKNQFFERLAYNYHEILSDFNEYSTTVNYDSKKRISLFGSLSSVRNQPNEIFTSERCFAHYILSKGIMSNPHNQLFSGKIVRNRNEKSQFLKNLF